MSRNLSRKLNLKLHTHILSSYKPFHRSKISSYVLIFLLPIKSFITFLFVNSRQYILYHQPISSDNFISIRTYPLNVILQNNEQHFSFRQQGRGDFLWASVRKGLQMRGLPLREGRWEGCWRVSYSQAATVGQTAAAVLLTSFLDSTCQWSTTTSSSTSSTIYTFHCGMCSTCCQWIAVNSSQVLCSIGSKYCGVLQAGILLQARQGSRGERDKWMEATLERLVVRQHAGIYKGQWHNIFCEESS